MGSVLYNHEVNYDWLASFVVFSEYRNFTRAAEALGISQPALHVQIKKLSDWVGRPLYRRRGRGLELTGEGQRLAAFGREVGERSEQVLAEIRGVKPTGPVTLAAAQGAFLYLLGPAIRRFPKQDWPLRLLTLPRAASVDAVRESRAQLAVAVLDQVHTDVVCEPLREVGQMAVMPSSHRLAGRARLQLADLGGEPIVAAPEGSPHRVMLSQALRAAGVDLEVAVEATGWELMLHFARTGMGVAVVNDICTVPRGMVGIGLVGLPTITYYLVGRAEPRHPGAEELRRLILASARR